MSLIFCSDQEIYWKLTLNSCATFSVLLVQPMALTNREENVLDLAKRSLIEFGVFMTAQTVRRTLPKVNL